jgi:hypothetical protein
MMYLERMIDAVDGDDGHQNCHVDFCAVEVHAVSAAEGGDENGEPSSSP